MGCAGTLVGLMVVLGITVYGVLHGVPFLNAVFVGILWGIGVGVIAEALFWLGFIAWSLYATWVESRKTAPPQAED